MLRRFVVLKRPACEDVYKRLRSCDLVEYLGKNNSDKQTALYAGCANLILVLHKHHLVCH